VPAQKKMLPVATIKESYMVVSKTFESIEQTTVFAL
jgi:hypothetical protein